MVRTVQIVFGTNGRTLASFTCHLNVVQLRATHYRYEHCTRSLPYVIRRFGQGRLVTMIDRVSTLSRGGAAAGERGF